MEDQDRFAGLIRQAEQLDTTAAQIQGDREAGLTPPAIARFVQEYGEW
jgi:hypothetical protein